MLWDPVLAAVGVALVRAFFADGAILVEVLRKCGHREIRVSEEKRRSELSAE